MGAYSHQRVNFHPLFHFFQSSKTHKFLLHFQVFLAKEAGLLYATVAISTDYDCWKDNEENVNAQEVIKLSLHFCSCPF